MQQPDKLKENKLFQMNQQEYLEDKKLDKGTLKQLVSGMKKLLQPFQCDFKTILSEDNSILTAVQFEIKIKNLK